MNKYVNFIQKITGLGGALLYLAALLPIFLTLIALDLLGDAINMTWIGTTASLLFFLYFLPYTVYKVFEKELWMQKIASFFKNLRKNK